MLVEALALLAETVRGAERVRDIVADLLTFARDDVAGASDIDLHATPGSRGCCSTC